MAASALPQVASLKGMFCYYGKHYVAFMWDDQTKLGDGDSSSRQKGGWLQFDDAKVKVVGPTWHSAVEACRANAYQPTYLFYVASPVRMNVPAQLPRVLRVQRRLASGVAMFVLHGAYAPERTAYAPERTACVLHTSRWLATLSTRQSVISHDCMSSGCSVVPLCSRSQCPSNACLCG